ncbi:MAG: ABC transporter, partial [Gordonia sp. (in: high G+C Gram-positive bacteria)]
RFPEWIRPFARNQPISQFTELMRGFDGGEVTLRLALPSILWATGVVVVAIIGGAWVMIRSSRR